MLLLEDHYNHLLKVRGAVGLPKACVEELMEAWDEDVGRLMLNAIGDTVNVWGFIRLRSPCSTHCFLLSSVSTNDWLAWYESDWLASTKAIGWNLPKADHWLLLLQEQSSIKKQPR